MVVHPSSEEMEDRATEESSVNEKVAVSSLLLVRATPFASADARESSVKLGSRYLGMTTVAVFFGESELAKSKTWTGLFLVLVVISTIEQVAMGDMVLVLEVDSKAIIDIDVLFEKISKRLTVIDSE